MFQSVNMYMFLSRSPTMVCISQPACSDGSCVVAEGRTASGTWITGWMLEGGRGRNNPVLNSSTLKDVEEVV